MDSKSIEWGRTQARALWDRLYAPLQVDVRNRIVLDWGCSWGYLVNFLADTYRPRAIVGNDISAFWETTADPTFSNDLKNVQFVKGNIADIDIPYAGQYDYVLSTSVTQYQNPDILFKNFQRIYEILRPGGEFVARIRTYGSYIGQDGHRHFGLPYVHLLYDPREMANVAQRHGVSLRYLNYLLPSTYFAMFAVIGFEVIAANRRKNKNSLTNTHEVARRFPWISAEELDCAELEVRLIRPLEEYEVSTLSQQMAVTR